MTRTLMKIRILTQLLVTYTDEAFAKMYIQHPFVATALSRKAGK